MGKRSIASIGNALFDFSLNVDETEIKRNIVKTAQKYADDGAKIAKQKTGLDVKINLQEEQKKQED